MPVSIEDVSVIKDAGYGRTDTADFVMIDDFLIDVSIHEDHEFESEITEFPVESGSNIADNIRPKPAVITMEGLVTNTPLEAMKQYRNAVSDPTSDAYQVLLNVRNKRDVVTIRTSLDTFTNMALESLSIPRDKDTGDALRFTAKFQQILSVTNKRGPKVAIPIAKGPRQVTLAPVELVYAQWLIDTKTHHWWDSKIGKWRMAALYVKDPASVHTAQDEDGAHRIGVHWHLYELNVEEGSGNDPMDAIRFTGKHPIRNVLAVPYNQAILHKK